MRALTVSTLLLVTACGMPDDEYDYEEDEYIADQEEISYTTFAEPDKTTLSFESTSSWFGSWGTEAAWGQTIGWKPFTQVLQPVRWGERAMRVEVQYLQPDVNGAPRAEVKRGTVNYEEWWYGFSIFLPASYTNDPVPEVVAQWHDYPDFALGEGWKSPPLWLLTKNGRWKLERRWDSDPVTTSVWSQLDGYEFDIDLGATVKGRWTDWVVRVRWDWRPNGAGVTEVWKNGVKVLRRVGPNCYNDAVPPYFKAGIYKSGWPGGGAGAASSPTKVLFLDELRQARASRVADPYGAVAPRGSRP